jgi:hypothetical protein
VVLIGNTAIRRATSNDHSFIMATWLRGLYYEKGSIFNDMDKEVFFDNYSTVIKKLLETSVIAVACLPDSEETIIAYIVLASGSSGVIHWAYCKKAWRKLGITKSLLLVDIKDCTHLTKVGNSIRKRYGWGFNPFLIG